MKEVTRIHIAKTTYDIELSAKKELEKYISSLEVYANDGDVLNDIEIRITELLAERNIQSGGVVTTADVEAVKAQLGEPHEFASEDGDIAVGADVEAIAGNGRKLYRNLDTAVLGGVLGGVASYFKISPLWTRLAFVVVLLLSFGTALFVYLLLWLIIPAARSAAERLMMEGKPVTLASIKTLTEQDGSLVLNPAAATMRRALSYALGISMVIAALAALSLTAYITFGYGFSDQLTHLLVNTTIVNSSLAVNVQIAFWLMAGAGVTLALLLIVMAYAFFKRRLSKVGIVVLVTLTVLGGGLAITSAIIGTVQRQQVDEQFRASITKKKYAVPDNFSTINKAVISGGSGNVEGVVEYIVDSNPRYEIETSSSAAVTTVTVEGTTAVINLDTKQNPENYTVAHLKVYGPALTQLEINRGLVSYIGTVQPELTMSVNQLSSAVITGTFTTLSTTSSESTYLNDASIENLTITAKAGAVIRAGTVRNLTVNLPDVCPQASTFGSTKVQVVGVTSGVVNYNDTPRTADTYRTGCATLAVGEEDAGVISE